MNNSNPYASQPGGQWQPQQQQPPHQPYQQPKKSSRGLIIGLVVAVLAIIAVAGALFVFLSGGSQKVADPEKVKAAFVDDQLTSCDLGDEFFTAAGWKDLLNGGRGGCIGFYETEEGDVSQGLLIGRSSLETNTEAAPEGLTGWLQSAEYNPEEAKCVMESETPELAEIQLSGNAPCETLYPMAVQLNNLVAQYRNGKGDLSYTDPAPKTESVAGGAYVDLIGDAAPLGTKQEIDSHGLIGATLTINEVNVTPDGKTTYSVCVDGTYNTGEFTEDTLRFDFPGLALIMPTGAVVPINFDVEKKEFNEHEDIPINHCIKTPAQFNNANLLIGAATRYNEEGSFSKAWSFRLDSELEAE